MQHATHSTSMNILHLFFDQSKVAIKRYLHLYSQKSFEFISNASMQLTNFGRLFKRILNLHSSNSLAQIVFFFFSFSFYKNKRLLQNKRFFSLYNLIHFLFVCTKRNGSIGFDLSRVLFLHFFIGNRVINLFLKFAWSEKPTSPTERRSAELLIKSRKRNQEQIKFAEHFCGPLKDPFFIWIPYWKMTNTHNVTLPLSMESPMRTFIGQMASRDGSLTKEMYAEQFNNRTIYAWQFSISHSDFDDLVKSVSRCSTKQLFLAILFFLVNEWKKINWRINHLTRCRKGDLRKKNRKPIGTNYCNMYSIFFFMLIVRDVRFVCVETTDEHGR